MNSINWPGLNVSVFIAQLVEHCNANAEATGSNPTEAPKTFFFFQVTLQFLKLRFTAMVTYSMHLQIIKLHILCCKLKWAMPLNFCSPEVEEQWNSSGVREKNGGIL